MIRALVVSQVYAGADARTKLRALAGMGCTVAAAIPALRGRAAATDELGVQLLPIEARGGGGPAGPAWDGRALRRAFVEFRPDVVHVEEEPWTLAAGRTAALARRYRVPLTLHTAETIPEALPLLARARRRRVLAQAAAVAATNHIAADLAGRTTSAPVTILPQLAYTPPPPAPAREEGAVALGFVGRVQPSKGLDVLIEALVRVHGDWTLTVVGTGPAQVELERLAAARGLASRVRWLGALPAEYLAEVWNQFDIFVLPARTLPGAIEATGRPLLDAMARGLPSIASASAALPETLQDGGRIVPENDAEALRSAIQQLVDDGDLRRTLGAAARRRVLAEYVPEAVARRTLEFWRSVPASSNPRA